MSDNTKLVKEITREETTMSKAKVEKTTFRKIVDTVVYFLSIFLFVMLLQRFVVQPVEVDGRSMLPSLSDKDHVLLEKVSFVFSDPKRFDVIVFQPYEDDDDLYYIKRVIGLPGETVRIENNIIYINEEPLQENYGNENIIREPGIAAEGISLAQDEFFVLGDNRNASKDSRKADVGKVKKESILGRAWCRIWPLKKFGFVKH